MALLPGMGARMRTSFDATAYAMLLVSAVMRSTLTPGPSEISYWVTVGPREKPVTRASTPNCSKTPLMAATTRSFASDRAFGGSPCASAATDGRRYGACGG